MALMGQQVNFEWGLRFREFWSVSINFLILALTVLGNPPKYSVVMG
jgi:hypothetical protein